MPVSNRILPALLVSGALILGGLMSGCSSPAPASDAGSGSDAPSTAPSSAAAAPAADALNACEIVNSSMLFATLKITVPDGVADNAETCTYKADGINIVVQTSSQASMYYPQSVYAASAVSGAVDLTGGDISYGYYLPVDGSGNMGNVQVFVAKGESAVFVTGNVLAPGTTQDVLNLATAISIAF